MNNWINFSAMTPRTQAACIQWINLRLRELARSGNSPKRPSGWAKQAAPSCRALVTPAGEIRDMEPLSHTAAAPVSLFTPQP